MRHDLAFDEKAIDDGNPDRALGAEKRVEETGALERGSSVTTSESKQ